MTVRIHLCASFGVPPERVWADIRNLETHGDWMADANELKFLGDQREGVGTEMENVTRVGPISTKDVLRVVEWDDGAMMAIEHVGAVTGTGRFTLVPETDDGTRFCWDEVLTFPWWLGGPIGERAARPVLRRIWQRNLRRLQQRVERGS
jgi:hypothetical protein